MTRPLSQALSQGLLLGLLAVMASLLALLWAHPLRDLALAGAALALIGLSLLLERLWPHQAPPHPTDKAELVGDAASFVLIFVALDGVLKWLTPFALLTLWPKGFDLGAQLALPLWQQTLLAMLWIEFAAWASHWAHHRFKPLWALHAMHHSPDHLYTLNNFRFHPLNHVLNYLAMMVPPLLIGIMPEAILIYTALALPVLLLQHSNVGFDFGRLNLIFNTNELHRWHHSAKPGEGLSNLGRALVIWDLVFGTYLPAPAPRLSIRIGLFEASRTFPRPAAFWAQLAFPFRAGCCR